MWNPKPAGQEAFLKPHRHHIALIDLNEDDEDYVELMEILAHCTNLQKLVVRCDWDIEMVGFSKENDDWWLQSTTVAEWTWERCANIGYWDEDSIWNTLMKTKKGRDRNYDIEVITRFQTDLPEKDLCVAFDPSTQKALRRWFIDYGMTEGSPQE